MTLNLFPVFCMCANKSFSLRLILIITIFCWIFPGCGGLAAQTIDNLSSFRMMNGDRYVRLHFDNDYFTSTDDYYTAGINLEYVAPALKKNPLNAILISSPRTKKLYGISIEQNGYTPKSIEHDYILYGDRPFSATLMLKSFLMSVDSFRHQRITSSLTLGVIGQAAGGYGVQKAIHEWISYTIPHGWQNQIHNDVVVNYELGFEKNIAHLRNRIIFNGASTLKVGTLNAKLSSGAVFMFGVINPEITRAFSETGMYALPTKKLRFHVYLQPLLNMVAYDATLEGGFFNKDSPYVIKSSELAFVTFQANYGFVISFNAIYLEYFKTIISKEFESGDSHRWGGIRVGVKF